MADVNLVYGKITTISANTYVTPYTPACAVDGNKTQSSNRWLSYKVPGWLMVDLQYPCVISRWAAYFLPNASTTTTTWSSALYGMRNYSLQTSMDTMTWTTVDSVANNANNYTDRSLSTLAVGRFVRFYASTGLSGNTQSAISLLEFEAYGHAVSAALSSLVLSSGALTPVFTSSTLTYSQQVDNATDSITVTPMAADSTAVITVNGVRVTSGQTSGSIHLAVGSNTISVVVTPVYGASATYTVTVNRADSQYLTSLTLMSGTNTYGLTPTFSKTLSAYTATVPNDATTVTVTPVAEGTTSTIKVNGTTVASGSASAPLSMNVGVNTPITVECSLPSGTKQTYTITVTRAESSYLSSLAIKNGPSTLKLVPNFASATLVYTVGAGSANTVSVIPVAQSTAASITVNGTAITSTVKSVSVTLGGASTLAEIKVTNGGITTTYQVTITKP
ncbi:MAG: cadherin-like beta sandwich domain-containing protein [Fibrobacteraceae bacterium]|nr:cadherin-like beta sandwich domain-containing protein [Fibrobacteraceae bacterium]